MSTNKTPINVNELRINQALVWRKPGSRFAKPVRVIAVTHDGTHVTVSDQDQKRHTVPTEQLSRK